MLSEKQLYNLSGTGNRQEVRHRKIGVSGFSLKPKLDTFLFSTLQSHPNSSSSEPLPPKCQLVCAVLYFLPLNRLTYSQHTPAQLNLAQAFNDYHHALADLQQQTTQFQQQITQSQQPSRNSNSSNNLTWGLKKSSSNRWSSKTIRWRPTQWWKTWYDENRTIPLTSWSDSSHFIKQWVDPLLLWFC